MLLRESTCTRCTRSPLPPLPPPLSSPLPSPPLHSALAETGQAHLGYDLSVVAAHKAGRRGGGAAVVAAAVGGWTGRK